MDEESRITVVVTVVLFIAYVCALVYADALTNMLQIIIPEEQWQNDLYIPQRQKIYKEA